MPRTGFVCCGLHSHVSVHLTAQNDLIDFSALDREQLPQWIEELEEACRLLRGFIRRLRKEV